MLALPDHPLRDDPRVRTEQWRHGPDWDFYGEGGEHCFSFRGARSAIAKASS